MGENITKARFTNSDYICKHCQTLYIREVNGSTDIVGRPQIHDPSTLPQRMKVARKKSRSQYSAGIYCFKEDDKIVYIGESKAPFRRREQHLFSNRSILKEQLKGCEWEIMEYMSNKRQRLIREFELIAKHKPKYNHPYRI